MSNFQPDLVWDENLATGWVRFEAYGNKEHARRMANAGRRTLGQMKSYHGVNGAQVQDREVTGGGGFYHAWDTLPDGTRIHAITNDGHDTVQIYSPGFFKEEKKKPVRENDYDPRHYLWIGVRVKDGIEHPDRSLEVNLIEPADVVDNEGNPVPRGIVGTVGGGLNSWSTYRGWFFLTEDEESPHGWAVEFDSEFESDQQAIEDHYATWWENSQFSPGMVLGDHQFDGGMSWGGDQFDEATTSGFNWTTNGLFCTYYGDEYRANTEYLNPFDPRLQEAVQPDEIERNDGSLRDFSGRDYGPVSEENRSPERGWDAVFVIDPWDDVISKIPGAKGAVDGRSRTLAVKRYMRENGLLPGRRSQVLPGEYCLVISADWNPPQERSDRNELIEWMGIEWGAGPGGPGPNGDGFYRNPYCDYRNHLSLHDEFPPMEVEVQIRMGRLVANLRDYLPGDPLVDNVAVVTKTENVDVSCEQYDDRLSVIFPFGADLEYDECVGDGGPNMGGPSYAQAIYINVLEKTWRLGELPAPHFGQAGYEPPVTQWLRHPGRFFIYGAIFPAASSNFAESGGEGLWRCMEAVTTGNFGSCVEMALERSMEEVIAMMAGLAYDTVWMFNPETSTFENVGPPATSPSDWASSTGSHDENNWYWYYEKALQYQMNCFNTYGILATSVGPFYEMTQNFVGLPGFVINNDCC